MTAMKARRGISGEQMVSMSSLVGSGRESTSLGGGVDGGCRGERGGKVMGVSEGSAMQPKGANAVVGPRARGGGDNRARRGIC